MEDNPLRAGQVGERASGLLIAAVAFLVLAGVLTVITMRGYNRSIERMERTYQAHTELDRIRLLVSDAHRGMRGYLLSGDDGFLTPFTTARDSLESRLRTASAATAGSPNATALSTIGGDAREALALMQRYVELRKAQGLEAAAAEVRRGELNERVKGVIASLAALSERMEQRLGKEREDAHARSLRTLFALGLLVALSALAVGAHAYRLRKEIAHRRRSEHALTHAYDRLNRAQAEIAAAHGNLRSIIDGTSDRISAVDADLRFIAFNEAYAQVFERYLGTRPRLGADLRELTAHAPDYREQSLRRWGRALAGEAYTLLDEAAGPDGESRYFDSTYNPILDDEGRIAGAVQVTHEVTEQKRAEEALRRFNKALHEANSALKARNRELQDFAYVASHDLQEPLRKIQSFAHLLQRDYRDSLGEEGAMYAERMSSAANRMSRLINDILSFSRVLTQVQPFEPVNLSTVLEGALQDLAPRLEETGGHVVAGDLGLIEGDATQIRLLFQNLVGNALKFHRPGIPPVVEITSTLEDATDGIAPAYRVLALRDNGIGFDAQFAHKLFQPFQRLHGRERYDGTGIGLAICRRIVERHGGTIHASSVTGEGSTFVVRLPVHPPATAKPETAENAILV